MKTSDFCSSSTLLSHFPEGLKAWEIPFFIGEVIAKLADEVGEEYQFEGGNVIHKTAIIEPQAILKAPVFIGANCFIAANVYLRGGVPLDENCVVGPGSEIKSSVILKNSTLAHFNFVGDSLIGSHVNLEAGAIIANYYNERENKYIQVLSNGTVCDTGVTKFGALIGDFSKIGANAVLSPGTLLAKNTIVGRLELINQQASIS